MEKSKPLPRGIFLNYFTIPGLKGKRKTTADDIIDQVCEYYGINRELLTSKHRDGPIIYPRQIACYL